MKARNVLVAAIIAGMIGDDKFFKRDRKSPTRGVPIPFVRRAKGVPRRNDPCPCGKGKKYKACCLPKQEEILQKVRNGDLVSLGSSSGGNIFSPGPVSGEVDVASRQVCGSSGLSTGGCESHRDSGQGEGSTDPIV